MFKGFKRWSDLFTTLTVSFKSEIRKKITLKKTKTEIFTLNQLQKDPWVSQRPKTATVAKSQSPVPNPTVIYNLSQSEAFSSNKTSKMQWLIRMRWTDSKKKASKKNFRTSRKARSFWTV